MNIGDIDTFLQEKYVARDKVCTINGLLMVQAMISRKLITKYSPDLLELMGEIVKTIERIKDEKDGLES